MQVYDLSVEGQTEFFANGFLVHNSNVCLSLAGRTARKKSDLPQPPIAGHACRSRLVAIMKEQSEKPKINLPPPHIMKELEGKGAFDPVDIRISTIPDSRADKEKKRRAKPE